jgi:hypothetical protein
MTGADNQQYRDEVGELIADYVAKVSGRLDARTERAAKAARDRRINPAAKSEGHAGARNPVLERASNRIQSALC